MRILVILTVACTLFISLPGFSQQIDTLSQSTRSATNDDEAWHTTPSLRWNATAALNLWVPAVSLVYEYPINRHVGLEVEGGLILPYVEAETKGEKFNGFRFRFAPKVYLAKRETNVFYLRMQFKFDYAKSLLFRTVVDPSASFQVEQLVDSSFKNIGYVMYTGYMFSIYDNRFIFDLSLGIGGTTWEEQLTASNGGTILPEERVLGQRNGLTGSVPVISFNIQFGYMF